MQESGQVFPMTQHFIPRKVTIRYLSGWFSLWGPRLFVLPHMIVGVGFVFVFLIKVALGVFGTRTEGRVDLLDLKSSKKDEVSCKLEYSFFVNEQKHHGESQVEGNSYQALKVHDKVPVVYLSWLPSLASDAIERERPFPHDTWLIGGFSVIWNGIVGVFFYVLYIEPLREKRLLKNGSIADGALTELGTSRSVKGRITYYAKYSYHVDGVIHEDTVNLTKNEYANTHVGMPIRAVYDPKSPQKSETLEYGFWKAVSPMHQSEKRKP